MILEFEIREFCMRLLRGLLGLYKFGFFIFFENNGIYRWYNVVLKG